MKFPNPFKRSQRPKPPKPVGSWALTKLAFKDLKKDFKRYAAIVSIVTVPLALVALSSALSTNETVNTFANLAIVLMNVVLMWAIVHKDKVGHVPKALTAYYEGSAAFVRAMVVYTLLLFLLTPLAIAAAAYVVTLVSSQYGLTTLPEEVLIGVLCFLFGSISLWWLGRFVLATVGVVADSLRPITALRYARRLTLGRFWRVMSRIGGLIIAATVMNLPITLLTALLTAVNLGALGVLLFKILTGIVILPFTNLYLYRLYRNLESTADVLPFPHEKQAGK